MSRMYEPFSGDIYFTVLSANSVSVSKDVFRILNSISRTTVRECFSETIFVDISVHYEFITEDLAYTHYDTVSDPVKDEKIKPTRSDAKIHNVLIVNRQL